MERERSPIALGTRVYTSDDDHLGEVIDVGPTYLHVRKGWLFPTERYIPFDAISRNAADGVYVGITSAQVDAMAWDAPPPAPASAPPGASSTAAAGVNAALGASSTAAAGRTEAGAATMPIGHTVAVPVGRGDGAADQSTRAVDEVSGLTGLAAFQEGSFEVRARHAEVIVGKRARVVEEIVLTKTGTSRRAVVQETVRQTRVVVEEVAGPSTSATATASPAASSRAADEAVPEPTTGNPRKRRGGRRRLP